MSDKDSAFWPALLTPHMLCLQTQIISRSCILFPQETRAFSTQRRAPSREEPEGHALINPTLPEVAVSKDIRVFGLL